MNLSLETLNLWVLQSSWFNIVAKLLMTNKTRIHDDDVVTLVLNIMNCYIATSSEPTGNHIASSEDHLFPSMVS